jgi:hypothetical protein
MSTEIELAPPEYVLVLSTMLACTEAWLEIYCMLVAFTVLAWRLETYTKYEAGT